MLGPVAAVDDRKPRCPKPYEKHAPGVLSNPGKDRGTEPMFHGPDDGTGEDHDIPAVLKTGTFASSRTNGNYDHYATEKDGNVHSTTDMEETFTPDVR